jgi:putative ABC transport system permease protein
VFRSAVAAALRHLYRGKLYAAIAVSGLSVGLCAVLLAVLYIRSQYSYDHFIPGYQDIYQVTMTQSGAGGAVRRTGNSPAWLAERMKLELPGIASVSRVYTGDVLLRLGNVEHMVPLSSADPDFFNTLPLRVLAGNVTTAMSRPDQLVITREVARKFFGEESPVGKSVEIVRGLSRAGGEPHAVTVGAVIEDIPDNRSSVVGRMFVSSRAAWTTIYGYDRSRAVASNHWARGMLEQVRTVVRLHPGSSLQSVSSGLRDIASRVNAVPIALPGGGVLAASELDLLPLDRIHTDEGLNPGFTVRIAVIMSLALVILIIAVTNFVNLLTARLGTRVVEVGMRKLAGASRATLAGQFFGEAFAHVTIAVVAAVAMTELLLPHVNAFLGSDAGFEYWKEPSLLGWMALGTVIFGLLAGFWPALVLSSLRPLGATSGARVARGGGGLFRQVLVASQFALLAGLILAASVAYLQRDFAASQALRFDTDQVLVLNMGCTSARMAELRKLSGVRDAACSGTTLLGGEEVAWLQTVARDGRPVDLSGVFIDDRTLGLYGIKLLAGRMPSATDVSLGPADPRYVGAGQSTRALINESAVRALGFSSAAAAIGPYALAAEGSDVALNGLNEIIGVVPDFSMASVESRIGPTVFYVDPAQFTRVSVKLNGTDIPGSLAAIDAVWKNTGGRGPLTRMFYEERVERMYQAMLREARAFGIASLVAISLALLGLLGLAASAADRRTREIGIRKALGAHTGDVLRMLLWQFSKPVIWANLIAWPVAGWVMRRWLDGFAYHIDLPLWLFPATLLVTVLIALATVSVHAVRVARARPVTALRYE